MAEIKIRGAVRIANQVKKSLKAGIPRTEEESFRQFVRKSLNDIENLCARAHSSPHKLPAPSRNAYLFLKNLDLEKLPLTDHSGLPSVLQSRPRPPLSPQSLYLKNIIKQQQLLQKELAKAIARREWRKFGKKSLHSRLQDAVGEIEKICSDRGVTPAALAEPSRRAYSWMKFLTLPGNLIQHLSTMEQVVEIGQQALTKSSHRKGELRVELTHCSVLYRCHQDRNSTFLQLSEGFLQAEPTILKAVVDASIRGKTPKTGKVIRKFAESEEFSGIIADIELLCDVEADSPRGTCYDLGILHSKVNQRYFEGNLPRPRLSWSSRLTYRKFGHYEPARDRIVISQTLDEFGIPQFVSEFVLYHELLHKQHGSHWVKEKRMAHTPAFREDEKRFEHYDEAQDWLTRLARNFSALSSFS